MASKLSFDLVVIGELNVDLILTGEVEPSFGQVEKLVESATLAVGSSSAIMACGAVKLGLKTAFIGKVGGDLFGKFMLGELETLGVNTESVVTDSSIPTGLSIILSRQADRAILTFPGSISALELHEVDRGPLTCTRHVHLSSYFLLERIRPYIPELFSLAHAQGATTSLDTNYDPAEAWNGSLKETLSHTDIFLPNETELKAISRREALLPALEQMSRLVPAIAVKRGALGALGRVGDTMYEAPSLPVRVVDTVGAGDSFDAGFIYGHLAGWEMQRTLRLACICGALSTQKVGGTAGQPTLEEALAYL